jgi:NADH dehydrogenase/NADH:ubiquinone oxidoreductase subunit G
LPKRRVAQVERIKDGTAQNVPLAEVFGALKGQIKTLTVLASPDLLLEEFHLVRQLLLKSSSVGRAVISYRSRSLTSVEEILVSPDYASNFRGAQLTGLVGEHPDLEYNDVLGKIRRKEIEHVLLLGDRAIDERDRDAALLDGLKAAKVSVAVLTDADSILAGNVSFVVPGRSILEKSGLLLNRAMRLQYAQNVVPIRDASIPEWRFIAQLGEAAGISIVPGDVKVMSDRDVTRWYLSSDPVCSAQGLTIQKIMAGGVQLQSTSSKTSDTSRSSEISQGASSSA